MSTFSTVKRNQNLTNHAGKKIVRESDWLTTNEVATLIGISPSSLEKARSTAHGALASIPYAKVGRSVRYFRPDILSFLEQHKVPGCLRVQGTK